MPVNPRSVKGMYCLVFVCSALAFACGPDKAGSTSPDADAGGDLVEMQPDMPAESQVRLYPVPHSILPAGVRLEAVSSHEGTLVARPGVYSLTPDLQADARAMALSGTHSRGDWSRSYFVIPSQVEVEIRLTADSVELLTPQDSVQSFLDEAIMASSRAEADPGPVEALQSAFRERGFPPEAGQLGHFFVAIGSEDQIAPDLRGTFNQWRGQERFEFRPISGRLWGRFVTGLEAEHEYKITYSNGASWFTDRANPLVRFDGIDTGGVGAFNSVLLPEAGSSRLYYFPDFESQLLGNARDIFVFVPDALDASTDRRALVVHDGNESITRGRFDQVAAQVGTSSILIFVALADQQDRMAEYTMETPEARGDLYARFVVEELLPPMRQRFALSSRAEDLGLVGASLGGLISFYIASEYPQVFGFAAGMSSSFFWADEYMIRRINERGCQGIRYYLDSGEPDDNHQVGLRMRDALAALGCEHFHQVEEAGRHEWRFWNGRFADALNYFD